MSLKKREPVSTIMTKQPISVNLTNSIHDVYEIIQNHVIRHVPVVKGDELIGMISKTDIERISFAQTDDAGKVKMAFFDGFTVEQVMTKNVQSVQLHDSVKDAAEMLSFGAFHAIPVLDGKKLIGIITTTDVINYLLEQY